jgi:DUF438 domain-containing protein
VKLEVNREVNKRLSEIRYRADESKQDETTTKENKMENTIKICTTEEAIKEVNKKRGLKHIGYRVYVRPFLPTDEQKGFPGMTTVKVKKADFIKAIKDCLEHFEGRGARIELRVPDCDFGSFYIG